MFNQIKKVFTRHTVLFVMAWLVIAACFLPLFLPDEGRYAGVARWMVVSGDWLTPRINGIPFLQKPPLMYWIDAIAIKLIGANLLAARAAPLVAAFIILMGVFSFLKRHVEITFAQKVVLVFATHLLFFGASRYANTDLLVAAGITLAVLSFADVVLSDRKVGLFWGYTACAIAFLSKGLIGVLIPGMVLLPWILYLGQWRKIGTLLHPLGLAWFVLLAGPWLYLMNQRYPDFLHFFFITQQFGRFSGGHFNNMQPWFFYTAILCASSLPLFFLATWKQTAQRCTELLGRPLTLLLVWWLLSVTVFFSIPSSKLVGYILPAFAPWAILLTALIRVEHTRSVRRVAAVVLLIVIGVVMCSSPWIHKIATMAGADVRYLPWVGVVAIGVGIGLMYQYRRFKWDAFTTTMVANVALSIVLMSAYAFLVPRQDVRVLNFITQETQNRQVVFIDDYYYDIPYTLDLQKPVAVVENWEQVKPDSWGDQIHDGVVFEPELSGKLVVSMPQFTDKLLANEDMLIFANPAIHWPLLDDSKLIGKYERYNVYDTRKK